MTNEAIIRSQLITARLGLEAIEAALYPRVFGDMGEVIALLQRLSKIVQAARLAVGEEGTERQTVDLREEYLKADDRLRTYIRNVEARVLRLETTAAAKETP
jgi:hypothetical protein